MYNDNQSNYWEVYNAGTGDNDVWYDEVGGQTYDGDQGFDHISYPGGLRDYSLTRMDDGGIMMSHPERGTDMHYGIEALWFEGENAGYAMDDAMNLVGTYDSTDHGYGGGTDYYAGTEGDDSWDDKGGNQTYDGGGGFDYVGYAGSIGDYSMYQLDDGGVAVTSYDGSTDVHYGMEGLWFYGENAGYAMEDALNWGNDNNGGGGGDDGYGGGDGDGYGGGEYLAGTSGDDVWDDQNGNQIYDGGDGYDQVNYKGQVTDYAMTRLDDGGVQMTHYDGSVDVHYGIDGFWFGEDQGEWYSMEDAMQWIGDDAGGGDGYGDGGGEYLAGTSGDDVWDDQNGNQIYDGGDGYDQVNYKGQVTDYAMTRLDDGGVQMTHYDGSVDVHYGIDGFWFGEDQGEWYSMDDAMQWIGDDAGGGDGYGDGGGEYLAGTSGDDVWDDQNGNQIYDGGDGYDQVNYKGQVTDYAMTRLDDGGVQMTHYDGSVDVHYGIDGFWFGEDQGEWYSMDDAMQWIGDDAGGGDGYGDGGDGGDGYYAGSDGDDFWDDKGGNQIYDGGDGYDQVNYQGVADDYSATRLDDGGVQMTHYDGSTDVLYGIDGLWFNHEQAWYGMDDMVEDYSDETYH